MNAQIIKIGEEQAAVLPVGDYRLLLDKAEMLEDVSAYDNAKAALASGDDELVPAAVAEPLLDGENPVKVWRKYRKLSQHQLADAARISQAYLAQIETGKREGGVSVYRAIAAVLSVGLDDLCP